MKILRLRNVVKKKKKTKDDFVNIYIDRFIL